MPTSPVPGFIVTDETNNDTVRFAAAVVAQYQGQLAFSQLAPLTMAVMEFLESFSELSGEDKHTTAILVVQEILRDVDPDGALMWDDLLMVVLPPLIESFINTSLNGTKLNQRVRTGCSRLWSLLQWAFPLLI